MNLPWVDMKIEEQLGAGTYGKVYRTMIGEEEYALKIIKIPQDDNETNILLKTLGNEEKVKDYYRSITDEFVNEIRVMQSLQNDPNIVSIKDYRIIEEELGYYLYILMECLESFTDYEVETVIDEKRTIEIGLDLCHALEACEKNHIIHRDLKPDNILVDQEGRCKVCDFGVAKNLEKTMTNHSIKGTFSFMAPEVYHGKSYNNRADIYSLGMILYRLMNRGRDPFVDPNQANIYFKDKETAINRRMNGEMLLAPIEASPELAEVILKACAYHQDNRYVSASQLKEDLVKIQQKKYRLRKKNRSGKRSAASMLKRAAAACLLLAVLSVPAKKGLYIYRSYQKLYDKELKKELEEKYYKETGEKLHMQAYVDGNGTLYIFDDKDFINSESVIDREIQSGFYNDSDENSAKYIWSNQKIKKIVINKGITEIPDYAFRMSNDLEEIDFPTKLSTVGTYAFAYCPNLRIIKEPRTIDSLGNNCFIGTKWFEKQEEMVCFANVFIKYNGSRRIVDNIPSNITIIGERAFADNRYVEQINLPSTKTKIGDKVFSGCSNLRLIENIENISVETDAQMFQGTVLYDSNGCYIAGSSLISFNDEKSIDTLHVPDGITEIHSGAFKSAINIRKIILPDSVRKIGSNAFSDCSSLEMINIPEAVDEIGSNAFSDCSSLETINIPKSIVEIAPYAFRGCGKLRIVNIPESVKKIGTCAFSECEELRTVNIPESVEMIGLGAFFGCELRTVNIPESVNEIGEGAFSYNMSLDISFSGNPDNIEFWGNPFSETKWESKHTKDGYVIMNNILLGCYDSNETIDSIPSEIQIVYSYAFSDNSNVSEIILPKTIHTIEDGAFSFCYNLEKLTIPQTTKELGEDLCAECPNIKEIKVPSHFSEKELKNAFGDSYDKVVKY